MADAEVASRAQAAGDELAPSSGPPVGVVVVGRSREEQRLRAWLSGDGAVAYEIWGVRTWAQARSMCSVRGRLRDDAEVVVGFAADSAGEWLLQNSSLAVVDAGMVASPQLCVANPLRLSPVEVTPDRVQQAVRRVAADRRRAGTLRVPPRELLRALACSLLDVAACVRGRTGSTPALDPTCFLEQQLGGATIDRAGESVGVGTREARSLARAIRRRLGVTRLDRVMTLIPAAIATSSFSPFESVEHYTLWTSRRALRGVRVGSTGWWVVEADLLGRTDAEIGETLGCSGSAVARRQRALRERAGASSTFDLLRLAGR